VGRRSSALIIILVFGLLLSFLYISPSLRKENFIDFYRVLESKKVDASLYRLINPEPVYLSLQDKDLKQYGFLPVMMEQADSFVDDVRLPDAQGNRYDGFGMGVNSTDAVSLIRAFEENFNQTIENKVTRGYLDDTHLYDCNFEYNEKQYYLRLEFHSLTALDGFSGFVPISVTSKGAIATVSSARLQDASLNNFRNIVNPSELNVFQTFNNTVVWTNNLNRDHSILSSQASPWVKLTLNGSGYEGQRFTISTEIPPGKSWDYRLSHYYENPGATVYDYSIEGEMLAPIHGRIAVNFYPVPCMNPQEAKSLYGQSGFDIRFPTYLPTGYEYKCGIHYDHFMLKEIYWNQTTKSPNSLTDYLANNSEETALNDGIIEVFAVRAVPLWHEYAYQTAQDRLNELSTGEYSRYYLQPRIIEITDGDDISVEAVAYQRNLYNWEDINILEVYDHARQQAYIFKGKVAFDELTKMAESMYVP
jgi:hypothetical protein